MRGVLALLLLFALTAGCADDPVPVVPEVADEAVVEDPWGGADRLLVLDWHADTIEFDLPLCLGAGSGFDLARTGEPIPVGVDHLEFTVSTAETVTAVQAGYSTDGESFTWLPAVHGGPETFTIPVPAGMAEPDVHWSFRHQMNFPEPAAQECYNGVAAGTWDIIVEAVKA